MTIKTKYDIEQVIYLKTDEDQRERIITAITIRPLGVIYEVCCGTCTSSHYDFEMSTDKNYN